MIERNVVEGKACTVSYVKRDWTPATPETAEMVVVTFDDGSSFIAKWAPKK